ncbi:branched-chain amino acid ABC transporter permease [Bradyrhizobium liaoningense]|uniref:branched-chain amino acid ABC transporter permease n=1 Tax=Bradyrhizobium liaoningense TaxID=43992 RepID=UPI001BAABD81|nr:branched-chain amino acid ABC transporter permease [Bradyrhizobium liaoningense]MBR0706961.1 branched-chain amino acid ABC transporter permease [Bradyrhizobium liaoningense]
MDFTIASMLALDGVTNGALYALLAMTIILVFAVTRILFIAQGEFVVFGAMSLAQLSAGKLPSTVWLLGVMLVAAMMQELFVGIRERQPNSRLASSILRLAIFPVVAIAITWILAPLNPPLVVKAMLSLALVAPMGTLLYRLVYRSLTRASVLTLLIVSVGVHFALVGLGLVFFGPEGYRTPAFLQTSWEVAGVPVPGQAVLVVGMTVALIGALFWLFAFTFRGMALRATAVNELGARIVGLSTERAGETSLMLAAAIGALTGLLIGSSTTIYYDTGFLIGLKGFVAAVFAGLASFPGALAGAIAVGLIESFGSFWSSAFKDSIVFAAVIPILLWRSVFFSVAEEH